MLFAVSLLPFFFFHFIEISSECESNPIIWTYYPCSFIITPSSFDCQHLSVTSSVDQCVNKEITFFWHFPFGNMTLILQADNNRPFLLHFSQTSLSTNKFIKNTYHLVNNNITSEERVALNNKDEMIILASDERNRCAIRFETSNSNIFDYGTFIRMMIFTGEDRKL